MEEDIGGEGYRGEKEERLWDMRRIEREGRSKDWERRMKKKKGR